MVGYSLRHGETGTGYKGLGLGIEGVTVKASWDRVLTFRIRRVIRIGQLSILVRDRIGGGSSCNLATMLLM